MHGRMHAAGAVDAQNAPTAPWKTAQHAVSHSAHTLRRLVRRREQNEEKRDVHYASHTKFLTLPEAL